MGKRHQPVQLAMPQPHLATHVFGREAPRADRDQVVFDPALAAILKGVAQLIDHPNPQACFEARRNVDWIEGFVYEVEKRRGTLEKGLNSLFDLPPVFLGILLQHRVRFEIHLRHAGGNVEARIVIWRRATEHRHPRRPVGQEGPKCESMRTTSRPTECRESIDAQMVEHPLNIRGVIPDRSAWLWVRETETGPVQ